MNDVVPLGLCRFGLCWEYMFDAGLLLYFVAATFSGLNNRFSAEQRQQRASSKANVDGVDAFSAAEIEGWAIAGAAMHAAVKILLTCSLPVAIRLLGGSSVC